MIYIYGLYESDQLVSKIRYVGQSENPQSRLNGHRNDTTRTAKAQWIQSLRDVGKTVNMVILDATEDKAQAHAKENAWILFGKALGWDLVNGTEPGQHRSTIVPEFANLQDLSLAMHELSQMLLDEQVRASGYKSELDIVTIEADVMAERMNRIEGLLARVSVEKEAIQRRWYKILLANIIFIPCFALSYMFVTGLDMGNDYSVLGRVEAYMLLVAAIFMPFAYGSIAWVVLKDVPFYRLSIFNADQDVLNSFATWRGQLTSTEGIMVNSLIVLTRHVVLQLIAVIVVGMFYFFAGQL